MIRYKEIGMLWGAAIVLGLLVSYVFPGTNKEPAVIDLLTFLVAVTLFSVGVAILIKDLIREFSG